MNDNIWIAIIGAAATVSVALINKHAIERNRRKGKAVKTSFMSTRTFVWVVAPLAGALITFLTAWGVGAIAASSLPIKAPFCIQGYFFPSGFIGDGEKGTRAIELNDHWAENCHLGPTCVKVVYHPQDKGWAGVFWQYPDRNWGGQPGKKIMGAKKLAFWARGQRGGEIVDFKAGGISDPNKRYQDSFEKVLATSKLTTEWQPFEIDLSGADTSSVIGAFAFTVTRSGNPQGVTFYIDGICFQ